MKDDHLKRVLERYHLARQADLETAYWGLRLTKRHYGCTIIMMMINLHNIAITSLHQSHIIVIDRISIIRHSRRTYASNANALRHSNATQNTHATRWRHVTIVRCRHPLEYNVWGWLDTSLFIAKIYRKLCAICVCGDDVQRQTSGT